MRRSQASAIEAPAPAAAPSTCATTGFGISCKIRETSMPRRRFAILASNANGARPSAIDLTSPPTQNVPPAPFRRTARTSWSSAARRAASTRPRVMSGLSALRDRKSTRLNSSHLVISYAVFCLKKKKLLSFFCPSCLHLALLRHSTPADGHALTYSLSCPHIYVYAPFPCVMDANTWSRYHPSAA